MQLPVYMELGKSTLNRGRNRVMIKKILSMLVIVGFIISLNGCSQQNLEDMTSGNGGGYATIVWGDRTYVPYGALSAYGERGNQIGIVDGEKDNKVYECKGYPVEQWIVNVLPHDAAMLYKEIGVTDIPEGWESEYEWNQ
jgi:hypothetical protein